MKKTILLMTIVAFLIGLYRWLTSDNEEKQETTTEEVKEPASEKEENVKPEETTEEVKQNGEVTVENHK